MALRCYNKRMSEDQLAVYRPNLLKTLGRGFRDIYDHLGYVVGATLVWFIVCLAVYAVTGMGINLLPGRHGGIIWLFMLPTLFVGYIGAVGLYYYVGGVVFRRHPVVGDHLAGIRKLFIPAVKLFLIDGAVTAIIVADCVFFLLRIRAGVPYLVMSAASVYLLLMWSVLSIYHLPVLIAQGEMESGPKPLIILKKSFLLTLDNPFFTLGLYAAIIAIIALSVLTVFAGFAVFALGASAYLSTHALRELFIKYEIIEPDPEAAQDSPWKVPEQPE